MLKKLSLVILILSSSCSLFIEPMPKSWNWGMRPRPLTGVKNFDYSGEKLFEKAQDFLPINGTDYVEFYVGNATIEGDKVIVNSPNVANPKSVRYGWADHPWPDLNFWNKTDLPAAVFRTDTWELPVK